jgi:hypothetical protein
MEPDNLSLDSKCVGISHLVVYASLFTYFHSWPEESLHALAHTHSNWSELQTRRLADIPRKLMEHQ